MIESSNRIRQARRQARLSQKSLAQQVGVHRSAVAQWEHPAGCLPTVENLARIAISTAVNFEWLATGRGPMTYAEAANDPASPALRLEFSAQSETEARGLSAMRRMDYRAQLAIVDMMEALIANPRPRAAHRAPFSR